MNASAVRTWPALAVLAPLLGVWQPPTASLDLTITARMHHLRSGTDREWAEFPERAEGHELTIPFHAAPNDRAWTLRVRHRDLKGTWRVVVNGKPIARLPVDEADTVTYWPVPAGTLIEGANELRVSGAGGASDDVLIGELRLIPRASEDVLSEAAVEVTVADAVNGRAIPSRITVADNRGTLVALGNTSSADHAVRPGVVYSRTGSVTLQLPAGEYVIYAGRGVEYSVATANVRVRSGERVSRRLTIRREVDTSGWAAMDTHVHTGTFARHGDATIDERMLTIAGEGLELPVSTEHNTRVDFDPYARAARLRTEFTPLIGSEVTTPARGHFNVFALTPEGPAIDQRAGDWATLRDRILAAAGNPVIILNHGRDVHGGFRPLDPAGHISVAGETLQETPLPANAMEVVNSGAVMSDGLALSRDWMGMLNRGRTLTPVGSSDSHDVSRYIVGQGRTYVRLDDRTPGALDVSRAIESVRGGHVSVSYGLLVEIDVQGRGPGDLVTSTTDLQVRLRVKGPGWTTARRVALYANGERVREQKIRSGARANVKWEDTWRLARPRHDVHLVAIAEGPGVTAPYWPTAKPYQPTSIEFTPYVLALSGAVFVDADGSGRFESAHEYARREISAADGDVRSLATKLGAYDGAVAVQAASLLRAQSGEDFEARIRSMMQIAPAHVARGLSTYLDAWKAVVRGSKPQKLRASPAAGTR